MKTKVIKTKDINITSETKKIRANKLLDSLQIKAAEPKTVVWDSCCRIMSDD